MTGTMEDYLVMSNSSTGTLIAASTQAPFASAPNPVTVAEIVPPISRTAVDDQVKDPTTTPGAAVVAQAVVSALARKTSRLKSLYSDTSTTKALLASSSTTTSSTTTNIPGGGGGMGAMTYPSPSYMRPTTASIIQPNMTSNPIPTSSSVRAPVGYTTHNTTNQQCHRQQQQRQQQQQPPTHNHPMSNTMSGNVNNINPRSTIPPASYNTSNNTNTAPNNYNSNNKRATKASTNAHPYQSLEVEPTSLQEIQDKIATRWYQQRHHNIMAPSTSTNNNNAINNTANRSSTSHRPTVARRPNVSGGMLPQSDNVFFSNNSNNNNNPHPRTNHPTWWPTTYTIPHNNNNNNELISQQHQKNRKKHVLNFIRVLMKYLENRDKDMHARAKSVIRHCVDQNKQNNPSYVALSFSMQCRLRALVGEYYWEKTESCLCQFLKKDYEKRDRMNPEDAFIKAIEVANIAASPLPGSESVQGIGSSGGGRDYGDMGSTADFGGDGTNSDRLANVDLPVITRLTTLDWNTQQKALDEMFDTQLETQYENLPTVEMPDVLRGVTLFDHQIKGIQWLLKKESEARMPPFYKEVVEEGQTMYLCEITQCSQKQKPTPIRGGILCDEMGLGKTLQVIGLILLGPPPGVTYKSARTTSLCDEDEEATVVPIPSETAIKSATVTALKYTLKAAGLKSSGKKSDRIHRIVAGGQRNSITGDHFPIHMKPEAAVGSSSMDCSRCTLIVCPVSVMSNWQSQVSDHVKEGVLDVRVYHGKNRTEMLPNIQAGEIDILLVSYHTLAAEFGKNFGKDENNNDDGEPQQKRSRNMSIFDIHFHRVVLDEAHTIRIIRSKLFKGVKEIKADRRIALTGTPFVNRADDIHSLLSFLGCQPLADSGIFRRAITQPIKNGNEIGLTRLRACMGCVSLRRSKNIVELKLVEKEVQLCTVAWSGAHKKLYDALFGTLRTAFEAILKEGDGSAALKNYSSIFEKLMRLRQTCCAGTLVSPERRDIALKLWRDVQARSTVKKLTAEEGLALLGKLKGTFTELTDSLPECGICLMEMEEIDCTILKGCSHVFCKLCIQQVFNKSNQICPYCRAPFSKADIIDKSSLSRQVAAAASVEQNKADEITLLSDEDFDTSPKIIALLEAIKSMKLDEKGVIFSQFTKYLDLIGKALEVAGHSFVRIDGSVPVHQRAAQIHAFNSEDNNSPRFIICSLLAAGTGINLTRGNHAFMMDCWWNAATENQAMDRIHRIGQKRKVSIIRFVMKDSVEERIVELQEVKSLQAKGVLHKLEGDEKRKALLGDLKGLLQLNDD